MSSKFNISFTLKLKYLVLLFSPLIEIIDPLTAEEQEEKDQLLEEVRMRPYTI